MKITDHILLVDNDEITLELATRFLEKRTRATPYAPQRARVRRWKC